MKVVKEVKEVMGQKVIEDDFKREMNNFEKLNLQLCFNSKSELTKDKDFVKNSEVKYRSKQTKHVYEELNNIDLKVHSNTGSQVNQSHPPVALIDPQNTNSYISNYPRPTIIFTHNKDVDFLPAQVSVSSKVHREKANADSYPVGAGLIFCASSLKDFENVKKYYQIQTRPQYEKWLESRQDVKLPIQDNEPVAFFELGSENEVTVNLNLDRPCKYVLLMPTDFRKKPIKFTKRFYSNNCEIQGFKIVGREVKIMDEQATHFESQIEDDHVNTGASAVVQVKKNGSWSDFKTLNNLKIGQIESLTNSYCVSLFDRTKSCVTGSSSIELNLSEIKDSIQGIRVQINEPDGNRYWQFKDAHFVAYKYPSHLKFKSKGLRRLNEQSILDLYTDNQKLGEFVKKLITVVQDKNELEYTRNSLLQHLNRLKSSELVQILKDNFNYKSFFEDPDLYTYSDSFKTTVFKTLNKIGLTNSDSEDQSFFEYTSNLINTVQNSGLENFDITTLKLIYMVNKQANKTTFEQNYNLLTDFIFAKALPELEKSGQYHPIKFQMSQEVHIPANVLVKRAKNEYELTTGFTKEHSVDYIKLLVDQDTQNLMLQMDISVFEVDPENNETMIYQSVFGDDVYQLCTRGVSDHDDEHKNVILINLEHIDTVSSLYRIKINHISTNTSKSSSEGDPVHAIVPLYYGQDTGVPAKTNSLYDAEKSSVKAESNKHEVALKLGGIEFNCYEKETMFIAEKNFTKKMLKTLKEPEASEKQLAAKRKEQFELIKQRKYEEAQALTSEIKKIKTRARSKLAKHNNITLSETLILASEIMNYLASDTLNQEGLEFGLSSLSEKQLYELLKSIVEWFLLPKEKVCKVINLKSAQKISKIILQKIKNANSIFFDLIERLLKKKSQTHKKIFGTLEEFIKEMSVPEILNELLNRLQVSREISENLIEDSDKLYEVSKTGKIWEKESMWITVGTLQIINQRLQKVSKEDRKICLQNLVLLGNLRFKANSYEHTMYYKLVLSLINECFKDINSDDLLVDATVPIKLWFNVLTFSTDPELYSENLKFMQKVLIQSPSNKKKAGDIVHSILVWFSALNRSKAELKKLEGSIFEGLYENDTELFSSHYCQSIDLFLASFRTDSNDPESSKLVSSIFNNIMSALNRPSKSASFAKIWNELFKCLAIIGSSEENVDKFVSTFLSLPGEIRDNLYTHFDLSNVSMDSTKTHGQNKFTITIVYKILRSFFKHGLKEGVSKEDELRVYTICNDLICTFATKEPCSVNQYKGKTPVQLTKEEYVETMHFFTDYLNCYLNKGFYNHMGGASYQVLGRLKMGVHIAYLVYNSEFNGKKLYDLFIEEFSEVSAVEKANIFLQMIIWLLLNGPSTKSKSDPCSIQQSRITKLIVENLPTKKEIVLELLPMVMKEVIKFDNIILKNCHKLGYERSSSFQSNSNTIISTLFNVCFNDKDLFNNFLVKMKGFDFLLQRLFSKSEKEESKEEIKGSNDEEETIITETHKSSEDSESLENLFDSAPAKSISSENSDANKDQNKDTEKKGIDKVNLADAGKTMKLIHSSVGAENQTQDWCMYKNGQRNRIVFKHIDKASKSDFIMRFECTNVIEVTDIEMGLIYYWGNYDTDMHYEPMQVFCEGGMSKNQIDWCVPLRLADDGGYRQSAVNVYGANFADFGSMNYDIEKYNKDPTTVLSSKLRTKSEVYRAKYITFRLRRPEICSLESSIFATVLTKSMSYGFTFFSVQGIYPDQYLPLKNALLDVQKENTLEILSECCSGNNVSETFAVIANDKEVIEGFKNSIGKLSQLLEQKEYLIKPIFLALSSQNSEMADWIIEKFLSIDANQKQIGLIGEIIKRDDSKATERIQKILQYIIKNAESKEIKTMDELKDILEIFGFFQGMTESVKIDYDIKAVDTILDKMNDSSDATQELVLSFILFLFDMSKPRKGTDTLTSEQIIEYLLKAEEEESEEKQGAKQRLASTLCAGSEDLSQIIVQKKDLLESFLNIDTNDLGIWKSRTRFWYNCAQCPITKDHLVKNEAATKVFNAFRKHFGPEVEESSPDKELNEIIVSFISRLTAGNEQVEKDIAKILKDDLTTSCNNDRLDYLNAIIVPLLHSEETVPVVFSVGDKIDDKIVYNPIFHKQKDASSENKFLFKSTCFSKSHETALMKMFKDHVHEHHDNYDKLLQKKWTLIAEDDSPKKGEFQKISDKISEKGNTLHIVKCTINGEQAIFGGFCASTFPSLVGLQSDFNYELPHDEANFVFYYKGDMENHFVMTNNKPFGYIYTDYELGGVISISGDFVLCSWSVNYSHTAGNIYNMKCIEQPGFASFYNNIQVERYECWHCDLGNAALNNLNSEKSAFFSVPLYKSLSPFNLLTENVVFHAPKKMKAKVIACELFGKKMPLRIKASEKEVDLEQSIEEITSNNQEGYTKGMYEFAYDRPNPEDDITKEQTKEVEEILNDYDSKYPVLEKFDGAQELVKACQKAVLNWTNKELREAWDSWLKEVESFISFPGFFARLTSDRKNSTLFFDILTGVPEKDTKEALKKREKEIEKKKQFQYNYKAPEFENEWIDKQLEMVKLTYSVVQRIFEEEEDSDALREKCLQNGTISTFIERVGILTSEIARTKVEQKDYDTDSEEEAINTENKKQKRDKNRKGVGYTTDVGQEWNVNSYLKKKESKNSQIADIIGILRGIVMSEEMSVKYKLKDLILESALLPVLENAFRSGSILEMAKECELYNSYLEFITTICDNKELRCLLLDIGKDYEPRQLEPVHILLDKLTGLADIFLKALNTDKDKDKSKDKDAEESKMSKELAQKIHKTNEIVQKTVSDEMKKDEESIADILKLPLALKYKKLLSPLRFGYMDMKSAPGSSSYTHYHSYNISQDTNIENSKIVRLAQEIADLSNSLPNEHTNAIFVRVDESRVDVMKAIICGAANTPYAHGCFEFDLYFDPRYPNTPPKCQLVTTGSGAVRFNPNLYADGKVCLSLLGTWRGSSTENWDAKFSTILQVLMSIQAIIMSEEVYYNEPGYEHEAGTTEGEAKNEAYSNIVRYCNIQYAMIDQMSNPSKGFEEAIRKHFFLKQYEIMEEVKYWLTLAEENKASYASLVECHNHSWCQKFKEEGKYVSMLKENIEKLENAFKAIKEPTLEHELPAATEETKKPEKTEAKTAAKKAEGAVKATDADNKMLEEVDIDDDEGVTEAKEMNIDDDGVKDRWSRYIGAMGIDAVAKQANARILISGLGAVGAEIAKNLVLAGCKELTLCDSVLTSHRDLSGNFFLTEKDLSTNRAAASVKKVQQLNYYVKVSLLKEALDTEKSIEAAKLKDYDIVVMTEASLDTQILVDEYCRNNNTKFIAADVNGLFCRVFNDFGEEFEVIDKDGEEIKEVMIKEITSDKEGLVTLQQGFKHNFEDGDEVLIEKVDGMVDKDGKSINGTIHKVITVTPESFKIGDTTKYSAYEHSGLAKQLKTKVKMSFKALKEIGWKDIPFDQNLMIADFEKMDHIAWSHYCYVVGNEIKKEGKYKTINDWTSDSFGEFGDLFEEKLKALAPEDVSKELAEDKKFMKFSSIYCVVNHGTFNPLCAFIGGVVSQEVVKAITNKFVPINQFFYYDAIEVAPEFEIETKEKFEADMKKHGFFTNEEDRYHGLRACIGNELLEKIRECNLFMVGAGAIGCELLKNYAMLGAGSGNGSILVTDPDIIEVSNLNRQFLFREKHLRKPKSVTAAAAAIHMNPDMKGKIIARLDKIHKATEDTYSHQFYKSISMVTNALDNVAARRYLDGQCVKARIPMLDSGTLGPKGHVQIVLPGKTESYSSTNDAEDTNEIPHCTLKMFPEETLHCVEWARDLFSQLFNQSSKSYNKIIEDEAIIDVNDSEQKKIFKEALSLIEDRPTDFKSCIRWARFKFNQYFVLDIKQLLHAYPLDHKTKEGKPFWSLPKRAPEALKFDPENELHAKFIASAACLRAVVFNIEIPFKAPREKASVLKMGHQATEFDSEVPEFKLDKSKLEELKAEVDNEDKKNEEGKEEQKEEEEETIETGDDYEEIRDYVIQPLRDAYKAKKDDESAIKEILTVPQEFEKDDDSNFHIDFIYSLANCRAQNYTLDLMDWLTTKLKAGRIIPALATTTAAIAGLQTLEMVKILKECKLEDMRNINLNLAVPSLMASEPGAPEKIKLREGLEVNIWDVWTVHFPKEATLNDLFKKLLKKYGLAARDVFRDGNPVFLHALDAAAPTGKKEKALGDLFKVSDDLEEVEVTVTFSDPDDKEEKILDGTPPVIIKFKK